jgi:outer membrane lipoprotein-sorting protein
MIRRPAALLFTLLILLLMPEAGSPQDASGLDHILVRLENNVSSIKTLSASFVQKKKMAAFSHEIVMSGRVYIRKPSTLAWHVMDPIKYSVLITDKLIRQWDGETAEVNEISFSSNPMLGSVLEHMTVWFSGRYTSLSKDYEISMAGGKGSPVVLEFTPRDGNMAGKAISRVSVGLARDERYLSWIRIVETGGDTTTIEFTDTVFDALLEEKDFEVKGSV